MPAFSVPALQLFTPQRMDLVVKYMFFQTLASGIKTEQTEALYRKHILSRTGGIEPSETEGMAPTKNGMDDYLQAARDLWTNMSTKGYDPAFPVPLGPNGLLFNASHRVACAARLGLTVPVVQHPLNGRRWDFNWFQSQGFTHDELALLLENYVRLTASKTILFILWGPVLAKWEEITQQIAAHLTLAGALDFGFGNWEAVGFQELVYDLYAHDLHDYADGMAHIGRKITYLEEAPRFFRVIAATLPDDKLSAYQETARTIKDQIREQTASLADADKFISCHTSDSPQEAVHMAATLLNPQNLAAVRSRTNPARKKFLHWLGAYRARLEKVGIDREECCIVGSGALEIAGIRQATDIDFTVLKPIRDRMFTKAPAPVAPGLDIVMEGYHRTREGEAVSDDVLIADPTRHVRFRGFKCASVDIIRDRKAFSARPKDLIDVDLIDRFRRRNGP